MFAHVAFSGCRLRQAHRSQSVAARTARFGRRPSGLTKALIAITVVLAPGLRAQDGAILVRVSDEFRRPISAARVTITGTTMGAVTDSTGRALFGALPSGAHTLRAIRPGYLPDSAISMVRGTETTRVELSLLRDRQGADSIVFLPASPPIDTGRLRLHVSPVAIVRYRQVRIAASTVRAGDIMKLQLFDDFDVVFSVAGVQRYRTTGVRISGEVVTRSGQWRGTANFVLHEGRLTGNIRIGPALFVIRPQAGGVHTIVEVDPSRLPRERPPVALPRDSLPPLQFLARPMRGDSPLSRSPVVDGPAPGTCSAQSDPDVGRVPEVRVLVGYSPAAREAHGSTAEMEEAIALAVDELQTALHSSGVRVDVALVGTVEVPITEATDHGALYWLKLLLSSTTTEPAVRAFREERQKRHADVMVLVSENAIGGQSTTPLWPHAAYSDSAYSVVGRLDMNQRMTLAHEIGHALGGHDEAAIPRLTAPPERYASAYRCKDCVSSDPLDDGWVTLMGRSGADVTQPREARIPRFSNPDRTWGNNVTGTPIGQPAAADHRATFAFFAAAVANYRTTPTWFVGASGNLPWAERFVAAETRDELRLADLDGDGLADAFRADPVTGTWWWSRNTSESWAVRNGPDAALAVATDAVRFADFNADGTQDVFWVADGKWFVSDGGHSAPRVLNGLGGIASPPLAELAFGDFAGDGRADVFRSDAMTGTWWVSVDGSNPWKQYLPAASSRKIKTSELRFADFDGDSRTDVFESHRTTTQVVWRYVAAGGSTWTDLSSFALSEAPPLGDLALGSFAGNAKADILVTTGARWLLHEEGRGPPVAVATSCYRLASLWIADVDGDGILDVFRTGTRP